jgi:hypothetical protein
MLCVLMLDVQVPKTGKGKKGKQPVNKDRSAAVINSCCWLSSRHHASGYKVHAACESRDFSSDLCRFISKLFLRGDSVILVLRCVPRTLGYIACGLVHLCLAVQVSLRC